MTPLLDQYQTWWRGCPQWVDDPYWFSGHMFKGQGQTTLLSCVVHFIYFNPLLTCFGQVKINLNFAPLGGGGHICFSETFLVYYCILHHIKVFISLYFYVKRLVFQLRWRIKYLIFIFFSSLHTQDVHSTTLFIFHYRFQKEKADSSKVEKITFQKKKPVFPEFEKDKINKPMFGCTSVKRCFGWQHFITMCR